MGRPCVGRPVPGWPVRRTVVGSMSMSMSEVCLATSTVRRPGETERAQTTSVTSILVSSAQSKGGT